MPDTAVAAAAVLAPADDLVDRLLGATLGALELLSVHLGRQLPAR